MSSGLNKDGVPEGAIEAAVDAIWFNLCGDIRQSKIDKLVYREAAEAALAAALPFLVQPQTGMADTAEEYVRTHGADIMAAMVAAEHLARVIPPDIDDKSYWRHQIKELTKMLARYGVDISAEISINSALSQPLPSPQGEAATHRHKKRGTEYVLIGFGKMQAETWQVPVPFTRLGLVDKADMREVAIYRSVDDGSLWVRPREEFEDGRFELLQTKEPGNGK